MSAAPCPGLMEGDGRAPGKVRAVATIAPELLRTQAFVDGRWVDADDGSTFPVLNPATGETIAEVPRLGAAETRRAIEAAARALPAWRAESAKERSRILRPAGVRDGRARGRAGRADGASSRGSRSPRRGRRSRTRSPSTSGSPRRRSDWTGRSSRRPWHDKRILATREPVGVTAGITPWNFPSAMVTRKSAPALAVGCTMVLKPAEQTPLSALAIAALAEEAGVPAGVFSVVTGDAEDAPAIGAEMTSNPLVRKLGFTGSTEVGKLLMRQCADQVKKVSLELGGNAPFIVFDDADLDIAVTSAHRLQVPELRADLHLGEPDARPGRDLRRVPRALHRRGRGAEGRRRVRRRRPGRPAHRRARARQGGGAMSPTRSTAGRSSSPEAGASTASSSVRRSSRAWPRRCA